MELQIMKAAAALFILAQLFFCAACAPQPTAVQETAIVSSATPLPTSPPTPVPLSAGSSPVAGAALEQAAPTPTPAPAPASGASTTGGAAGSSLSGGASTLRGGVSDVAAALRDLNARAVGDELVVELPSDVLFDFDKWNIRADAAQALEKLLLIINAQSPAASLRIEGHTDAIADDAYNQQLSERRAESVKEWLGGHGIERARMLTRGFGESQPRAANAKPDGTDDPQGRQRNRRVEVFIKSEQ